MIRRWSCLNNFNLETAVFKKLHTLYKIDTFKNNVSYKKYTFGVSKFKRRAVSKWKRRGNWLPYTNVFKTWSVDFFFNKNFNKFQYLSTVSSNMSLIYNFIYSKKKTPFDVDAIFNFFSVSVSRKSYNYFSPLRFYYKNINTLFSFSYNAEIIKLSNHVEPIVFIQNKDFFHNNLVKAKTPEINPFFKLIMYLSAKQFKNFYEALLLFFFFAVLNVK